MTRSDLAHTPPRPFLQALALASIALMVLVGLTACQTRPTVRTQSAPTLDILKYQSFGFVEHPDTDKSTYTTITTRYLKDAVAREMVARGYTQSEQSPDLLVNFNVGSKDKVESTPGPAVGVGYGRWGWRNWGWGVGYGGSDVRTVTEGSLTIDVVDQSRKELVWTGTAQGRLTKKALDNPQPAIDDAVSAIFAKYPKQPLTANTAPPK
jgi:hypothetical protein